MNVAELARRAIAVSGLPIVFVSGHSDTVALNEIGAVVLRTPSDLTSLSPAIRSVIHWHAAYLAER